MDAPWMDGFVETGIGKVPRVRAALRLQDRLGSLKTRWGIGRMRYTVPPGLYAVGEPGPAAPVLVSANYKLSFDRLRSVLTGRSAWLLVLDTKGINVWCAAGKGTFGTDEIVRQVQDSGLERVVAHRRLILPQLGAPGVSAHQVRARCGFGVIYGPIRAADLPAFLDKGLQATPEMRRVRFGLRDRVILVPVELVMGSRKALVAAAVLVLLGGLGAGGYSLAGVRANGLLGAALVLGAFLGGAILGPILLPWLPGRAFSLKGAFLGLALVAALAAPGWPGPGLFGSWWHLAAWALLIPTITSFVVLAFTGASTFTSLSGVLRELRYAVPAQITAAILGVGLWIAGLFVIGGR